jgi:uncharacterized protein YndB with AHSA1/START domain
MKDEFIARVQNEIHAPIAHVWEALTNPKMIKQYMFGTTVTSDWEEGSHITWKGEWKGKPYEDKGKILQMKPGRILQYSHYSPMSGQPDTPPNYHIVTIHLAPMGLDTDVTLTQDNNSSEEERKHSEELWGQMLHSLKKFLEK